MQCGGPSYAVQLGRRDGMSSMSWKCSDLPAPHVDIPTAAAMFANKGFNSFEMAALMCNYYLRYTIYAVLPNYFSLLKWYLISLLA
jgi:hypothetical protein